MVVEITYRIVSWQYLSHEIYVLYMYIRADSQGENRGIPPPEPFQGGTVPYTGYHLILSQDIRTNLDTEYPATARPDTGYPGYPFQHYCNNKHFYM